MEKKGDLRVRKTYDALMAAFEEVLSKKTFDELTVNELCDRAKIRRPTFYAHFEDKYDFLRFYLNEIQLQIEAEADEATSTWAERLGYSWTALLEFVNTHPDLVRMGLKSPSIHIVLEIVTDGILASSRRELREYALKNCPEMLSYVNTVAAFLGGGIIQNLKRYLYGECKNADELSKEMSMIFNTIWEALPASR